MEHQRIELFCSLTDSACKSIQRLKATQMDAFDLSAAHTRSLCLLLEALPTGLTQTELAQRCGMDRAQISRVLSALRNRNYLTTVGQGDYKKRYVLTEAGIEVANQIEAMIEEIYAYVGKDIPREDLIGFYRTFSLIEQRLKQAVAHFGCAPCKPNQP